jgi:hypothetical protein
MPVFLRTCRTPGPSPIGLRYAATIRDVHWAVVQIYADEAVSGASVLVVPAGAPP